MDESLPSQPNPSRRGQGRDNDILVPRTEIEVGSEDEGNPPRAAGSGLGSGPAPLTALFTPPVSALGPLFRHRFERIYECRIDYDLDINNRATMRVLGGYYKSRRLIRIYARDREQGLRPVEELFDTFLHEMAHHLEYTEPFSFSARSCGRVPGRMHSRLFWKILGELKYRWARLQRQQRGQIPSPEGGGL
jgi:hypothetical protein